MKRGTTGLFSALILAMIAGCATPAVEIDYRCVFPDNALFDLTQDLSIVFADALAHQANLDVLSQTRQNGKTAADVTYIVSLKSRLSKKVFVNVLFNKPTRTVVLTITGDIQDPEAIAVGQKASAVFSKLFPGSTLDPFQARDGLFGR